MDGVVFEAGDNRIAHGLEENLRCVCGCVCVYVSNILLTTATCNLMKMADEVLHVW